MNFKEALYSLRPTAKYVVRGENEIEWLDTEQTQPTNSEIEAEITRLQTDYNAKQYQRDRASKYPAIGDQLDKLWHSIDSDETLKTQFSDFYNAIKTVKDKYPKE